MPTTAQRFFLGTVDDDQSYGTTIKKNQESAPAANSATTMTWTSTTAAVRTHVPLAATTAASDTSDANAWAFNNGGADGLGSTSTAERWIKAGAWSFSMSYTLNAPALLATIACTVTARVYRVSAAGTRTLLFTAPSANFSATGVVTWNSAPQPEIVLAAGEVVSVGFTAVSAATANVLNQVTNTVLRVNLGASSYFDVPSPGVRALGRGDYALPGSGALAAAGSRVLGCAYSLPGSGTLAVAGNSRFAATYALTGTGIAAAQGSSVAGAAFFLAGAAALSGRLTRVLAAEYDMDVGSGTSVVVNEVVVRPIYIFDG
jgi:hypothetical protein